jgi:ABC-2 type transport system permease protein
MNIIKQELKQNFKSWLIWIVSLSLFIAMMMLEFSAYKDNPELLAILDAFPKEMLDAMGLSGVNLTTVSGFTSVSTLYISLMVSIYAIMLGSNLLAKERKNKTSEFIFVMPVKRERLLVYKWFVGLIYSILMSVFVHLAIIISTFSYNPDSLFFEYIGWSTLAMSILLGLYMSFGLFLASMLLRPKLSLIIGPVVVFVTYIMSILIGLVEQLNWLRWLTPFEYFKSSYILQNLSVQWQFALISGVIIFASLGLTVLFYRHKDIPI